MKQLDESPLKGHAPDQSRQHYKGTHPPKPPSIQIIQYFIHLGSIHMVTTTPPPLSTHENTGLIWVRLKITGLGLLRCLSSVPFTKVPFCTMLSATAILRESSLRTPGIPEGFADSWGHEFKSCPGTINGSQTRNRTQGVRNSKLSDFWAPFGCGSK